MSKLATELELARPHVSYRNSFLAGLKELPDSEKHAWIYLGDAAPLDFPEKNFAAYIQNW